ncbi:MAG: hypothetical protein IT379_23530 [Deltaproteobacteria bacterium]|nr:hypothetical protein [Deltaproteobacteria bacterium]
MRRTSIESAMLAALCACAAACSPSDNDIGHGPVPLERLDAEATTALCHALFDCRAADDDWQYLRLVLETEERCTRALATVELFDARPLVEAGRVAYDAAAARACLEAFASSCSIGDDPSCARMFTGTLAIGAACTDDRECAGDAYCERSGSDGSCGECRPRARIGESCDVAPCTTTERAECDWGEELAVCVRVVQGPPANEGEACGDTTAGVVRTTVGCAEGLHCASTFEDGVTRGACRVPLPAGAACDDPDTACADGHLCVDGTCAPITLVRVAGAPCGAEALAVCDPVERLVCDEDGGTCTRLGDGRAGSACEPSDDFPGLGCERGLACIEAICEPARADGAPCASGSDCASGFCDDDDFDGAGTCGLPTC